MPASLFFVFILTGVNLYMVTIHTVYFLHPKLFLNSMLLNEKPFERKIAWNGCKSYRYNIGNIPQVGVVFLLCVIFFPR